MCGSVCAANRPQSVGWLHGMSLHRSSYTVDPHPPAWSFERGSPGEHFPGMDAVARVQRVPGYSTNARNTPICRRPSTKKITCMAGGASEGEQSCNQDYFGLIQKQMSPIRTFQIHRVSLGPRAARQLMQYSLTVVTKRLWDVVRN